LLRILAEDHDVFFLGLARHDREAALLAHLPVVDGMIVPNPLPGSIGRSASALVSGASLQQGYAEVPEFRRALRRLLCLWRPDVMHLNVFRTAHLVNETTGVPVVVDLDEFRSGYYAMLARTSSSRVWRAVGRVEAPRMAQAEQQLVAAPASLLVSSPTDVVGPNTFLVRTPCDLEAVDGRGAEPVVVFVGRLHYRANVEGIRWFVSACWPQIRAAHRGAVLRIVGEAPTRAIRRLAGRGIEVVPDVADVRPHYEQAKVAIVPVATGTGVQMKLVQALAAGVPVVSFRDPLARAGLAEGQGALCAQTPFEWCSRIGELLADGGLRAELAGRGSAWARANHHSTVVRQSLLRAYGHTTNGAALASISANERAG
jgi:glycosyltransferase involved in cell wall biosynthesis